MDGCLPVPRLRGAAPVVGVEAYVEQEDRRAIRRAIWVKVIQTCFHRAPLGRRSRSGYGQLWNQVPYIQHGIDRGVTFGDNAILSLWIASKQIAGPRLQDAAVLATDDLSCDCAGSFATVTEIDKSQCSQSCSLLGADSRFILSCSDGSVLRSAPFQS